jgi:hypothetical protein
MTDTDDFERDLAEIRRITEEHGYTVAEDDDMSAEDIEAVLVDWGISPDDPKIKAALAKVRRFQEWRKSKKTA